MYLQCTQSLIFRAKSLLFKCIYTVDFGKNKESKEKPLTVKIVSLASIVLPAERELNTVGPNHFSWFQNVSVFDSNKQNLSAVVITQKTYETKKGFNDKSSIILMNFRSEICRVHQEKGNPFFVYLVKIVANLGYSQE